MKKSKFLLPISAIFILGLTGCGGSNNSNSGGGSEDPPPREAGDFKVKEMKIAADEGNGSDVKPTVSTFTTDDGKLGIRINGIDLNDGNGVQQPSISNMKIEAIEEPEEEPAARRIAAKEVATPGLEDEICESIETGSSGSGDKFDIVVSLDTTGSMGSQAGTLANKIVDFAKELEDQKLDVSFAGITVGDAYATIKASGSSYAADGTAKGSLGEPPTFDNNERPDTGLELINATDMQAFFTEVSSKVGSGQGGGDGPENYLGPIDYFNQNIAFREDAGRFFIAIGDECAHTPSSRSDINESAWKIRDPALIEESLIKDGAAVHLIWANTSCSGTRYDMTSLQTATGGSFTNISGADLLTLPAIEAIGIKRSTLACEVTIPGSFKLTFDVTVENGKWEVTATL